jgi:hypothetical protein
MALTPANGLLPVLAVNVKAVVELSAAYFTGHLQTPSRDLRDQLKYQVRHCIDDGKGKRETQRSAANDVDVNRREDHAGYNRHEQRAQVRGG